MADHLIEDSIPIEMPRELVEMIRTAAAEDDITFGETIAAGLALYLGLTQAARLAVHATMSGAEDQEISRVLQAASASLISTRRVG